MDPDARDATAATAPWRNAGALGGAFERSDNPNVAGIRAVQFDGTADAFRGPQSVAEIEGDGPRSIEVWALRPSIDGIEETIVAWGRREQNATSTSLNRGTSPEFGGATHWAGLVLEMNPRDLAVLQMAGGTVSGRQLSRKLKLPPGRISQIKRELGLDHAGRCHGRAWLAAA